MIVVIRKLLIILLVSCGGTASTSTVTSLVIETTTVAPSCATAQVACVVGDAGPGGGIVFYVASTPFTSAAPCGSSCFYLESAPNIMYGASAEVAVSWGCYSTSIAGATRTGIGDGFANTLAIVAGCSESGIAAKLVDAYDGGTKTDWFLPSLDELNQLYINQYDVGNFGVNPYFWSSSEVDATSAWSIYLGNGFQAANQKTSPISIRPIRAF